MVTKIKIDLIDGNPYQTRILEDEENFQTLKKSIQDLGLLQPILVRPHPTKPGRYEVGFGHRRLKACKSLNYTEISAEIKPLTDKEMAEVMVTENIARSNLNPIEQASSFKLLMDRFGYIQEEVAKKFGVSRSFVANRLRLLAIDAYLKKCVVANALSADQALMISTVPDIYPYRLADIVINWSLNIEETRSVVKQVKSGQEISFPRQVPLKSLCILDYDHSFDSDYIHQYVSFGKQLLRVKALIDGFVIQGIDQVVAAHLLGLEQLHVDIVIPIRYLRERGEEIMLSKNDMDYYDGSIFPSMKESQRKASEKLRSLIAGQEEQYPIIIGCDAHSILELS